MLTRMRDKQLPWRAAVGELLVIAVGILLALAVDDWRTARAEDVSARSYAERLAVDLRRDLSEIDALEEDLHRIGDGISSIMESLGRPTAIDDSQSLGWLLSRTTRGFRFDSQRHTYDELVSTGRLTILPSPELRNALARYYHESRRLPQPDNPWAIEAWAEHRRALNAVADPAALQSIAQPTWQLIRGIEPVEGRPPPLSTTIEFERIPIDSGIEELLSDARYRNSLSALLDEISHLHGTIRDVRAVAQAALSELER